MGNKHFKCSKQEKDVVIPGVVNITQREKLATWHRTDIALTDVYEIMETLGHGHMGEVYKVRRKVENRGLHNKETREKASSFVSVLDESEPTGRGYNGSLRGTNHSEEKSIASHSSKSSPIIFKSRKEKKLLKLKNEETLKYLQQERRKRQEEEVQEQESAAATSTRKMSNNEPGSPKIVPKSILKNPMDVNPKDLENLARIHHDEQDNEDDGEKNEDVGMDYELDEKDDKESLNHNHGSPMTIQHKDSNLLHAHFLTKEQSENSLRDDVSEGEGIVVVGDESMSGSEHDSDRMDSKGKKTKKWVPKRTIRFQRLYACKTIATEKVKEGQLQELLNEIYMMRKMDHPYIIRLYEVYQVKRKFEHLHCESESVVSFLSKQTDSKIPKCYKQYSGKIWLVMDLCTGGNLGSRKLKEPQVTVVAEQILRGIAYLHRRGICHRDLKMENILYEDGSPNSTIRLIDFGLSQTYDITRDSKQKGAAYCLSPEVAGNTAPYTAKSDVWSVGVIIWILLAGDYPFLKEWDDLKDEKKKEDLLNARFSFGITWKGRGITQDAKMFVSGCLKKNPEERWSAIQALEFLQDTWIPNLEEKGAMEAELEAKRIASLPKKESPFKKRNVDIKVKDPSAVLEKTFSAKNRKDHEIFDNDIVEDIMRFIDYGMLKKTALIAMANTMDRNDVGRLSEVFLLVDSEQTGTISLEELKVALEKLSMPNLDEEQIKKIFSGMDHDKSGQIHYAEFLAALAEGAGLVTMERVSDAFDRIDADGKGYISPNDLKNILGENYSKDNVEKMILEGDFKKNGRIDFDEFVQLMFDDAEVGLEASGAVTDSLRSLNDIGFDRLKDQA
jgi:calcium-dependent protein kinase